MIVIVIGVIVIGLIERPNITVPQKGHAKKGFQPSNHQQVTFESLKNHSKVTFSFLGNPF